MANAGVYSREDNSPEGVGRSVQDLSGGKTIDARFMEIYPNYADYIYPNETFRIQPTNFVRTIPMVAPVLSRIRIVQRFYAVHLRTMWQPWEKYIDISNEDYDFTLEEPYLINCTGGWSAFKEYGVIGKGLTNCSKIGFAQIQENSTATTPSGRDQVYFDYLRSFCLKDGFVFDDFVKNPASPPSTLNLNPTFKPRGGLYVMPHDLMDYFDVPLYTDVAPYKASAAADVSENSVRVSAFKACAYQLAYSFGYRLPNVQKRVDDYFEMAQSSDFEFSPAAYVSWRDGYLATSPVGIRTIPEAESFYPSRHASDNVNFNPDFRQASITSYNTSNNSVDVLFDNSYTDNKALSSSPEAVLRTSWDKCELFPLKAGANASLQAWKLNSSGSLEFVPSNISLTRKRFANWKMDYFTSANPWQQRGTESKIPVSGTLDSISVPVTVNGIEGTAIGPIFSANVPAHSSLDGQMRTYNDTDVALSLSTKRLFANVPSQNQSLYVSPSNFRFAMALQRIKEMSARTDGRYKHFLSKFYGSFIHDDRIDYPEYLGGFVQDLNVDVVTQTSESASTDLGTLAGNGVSAKSGYSITYHAKEHAVIIGLVHIIPETEYVGGLNREDNTADPYDWMLPQFSGLSEQPVFNYEIACVDSSDSVPVNNATFGYEPYLNYLRGRQKRACGAFRDSLNMTGSYEYYKPWIIQRDFGKNLALDSSGFLKVQNKVPTLSDKFLSGRGTVDNSMFTVADDRLMYPFMIDSYFKVRATRVIPSRGVPRL